MEEILASIRRILNDEDVPATPEDTAAAPATDNDVLILDDSMLVSAHEHGPDHGGHGKDDPEHRPPPHIAERVFHDAGAPEPTAPETLAAPPEAEPPHQEMEAATSASDTDSSEPPAPMPDLIAPEAADAAASSVGSLKRTLAASRATQVHGGGPTLEDLVRAELRPLLKEWLDTNLPPLVDRLVRAAIERVVSREFP
jgi:uncharacterized protein